MKKFVLLSLIIIAVCISNTAAQATILTFEDLYPSIPIDIRYLSPLINYGGFTFNNAGVIRKDYSPGSGYDLGTFGNVSLFTPYSNPLSMSRTTAFNLSGAYITSAWFVDNEFTAEGWLGADLKYSQTFATSNDAAHWFDLNFANVDKVVFKPKYTMYEGYLFQDGHLSIDGMVYSVIPEPTTLSLLGLGLLGILRLRKKRS